MGNDTNSADGFDPHLLTYDSVLTENWRQWRAVCLCGWESPRFYATKQGAAHSHRAHRGGVAQRRLVHE